MDRDNKYEKRPDKCRECHQQQGKYYYKNPKPTIRYDPKTNSNPNDGMDIEEEGYILRDAGGFRILAIDPKKNLRHGAQTPPNYSQEEKIKQI